MNGMAKMAEGIMAVGTIGAMGGVETGTIIDTEFSTGVEIGLETDTRGGEWYL